MLRLCGASDAELNVTEEVNLTGKNHIFVQLESNICKF